VSLIEVIHEPPSTWTKQRYEKRASDISQAIASRGLASKPLGALISTDLALTTQGVFADGLSWIAVEAFKQGPGLDGDAAAARSGLQQAKSRISKDIIFVTQAYNMANPGVPAGQPGSTWSNVYELTTLQDVPYIEAYNDPSVIGILLFAYGRGGPNAPGELDEDEGGTQDLPYLKLRHVHQSEVLLAPDFNKNFHPDLVWRNISTGKNRFWLMNGRQLATQVPLDGADSTILAPRWQIRAVGDLDGNRVPDVIWHDTLAPSPNPNLAAWLYHGAGFIGGVYLPDRESDANWKLVGAADINRDGRADLLWHNQSTDVQNPERGRLRVWYMAGSLATGLTRVGAPQPVVNDQLQNAILIPPWEVGGVADMNGDGYPDLVIRYYGTHPSAGVGALGAWLMQDRVRVSSSLLNPANNVDLDWRLVGVADVLRHSAPGGERDGKPDLIWQHTRATNNLAIWYMNGLSVLEIGGASQYFYLDPATEVDSLNWKIVGVK
jgi:hypothetical protein